MARSRSCPKGSGSSFPDLPTDRPVGGGDLRSPAACQSSDHGSDFSVAATDGPPEAKETVMKFLLVLHNNPAVLSALGPDEQQKLMDGHAAFIQAVQESGELIITQALGDPAQSAVVRVR